jgi:hypothetical protein
MVTLFCFLGKRKGEGMNAMPNLQGVVPFNGNITS